MSETTFMGVPREKINWYPAIDYDKCNYCMECADFCPHGVFAIEEGSEKKLVVKNPNNCVVFCRACGKTCGLDALTFPDKGKTAKHIKEIRKEEEGSE